MSRSLSVIRLFINSFFGFHFSNIHGLDLDCSELFLQITSPEDGCFFLFSDPESYTNNPNLGFVVCMGLFIDPILCFLLLLYGCRLHCLHSAFKQYTNPLPFFYKLHLWALTEILPYEVTSHGHFLAVLNKFYSELLQSITCTTILRYCKQCCVSVSVLIKGLYLQT